MNKQDEKKFYTGMVILGLIISGKPLNSIPELTNLLIKEIMDQKEDE